MRGTGEAPNKRKKSGGGEDWEVGQIEASTGGKVMSSGSGVRAGNLGSAGSGLIY